MVNSKQPHEPIHGPPASVTVDGVEPHPHKTGHRLIDLIVAGSAILISCVSLVVAVDHGRTMQKLVAASSWPLLQFTSGNTDDKNALQLRLSVENSGVGPAIVKRFAVRYEGKSYSNQFDLLRDCCGYRVTSDDPTKLTPGTPLVWQIEGNVIRSGESADYIVMDFTQSNAVPWRRLDSARFKLKFETCYCSVLGDCWESDLRGIEPKKVESCPIRPAD